MFSLTQNSLSVPRCAATAKGTGKTHLRIENYNDSRKLVNSSAACGAIRVHPLLKFGNVSLASWE